MTSCRLSPGSLCSTSSAVHGCRVPHRLYHQPRLGAARLVVRADKEQGKDSPEYKEAKRLKKEAKQAKKELMELMDRMEEEEEQGQSMTIAEVSPATARLEQASALPLSLAGPGLLAARDQQLWERQEALWQREMARWDAERAAWAAREAALLQHIASLQSDLLQRAAGSAPSLSAPTAHPSSTPVTSGGLEADVPAPGAQSAPTAAGARLEEAPTELADILSGMSQKAGADPRALPSYAVDLAAAIRAVDATDVMTDTPVDAPLPATLLPATPAPQLPNSAAAAVADVLAAARGEGLASPPGAAASSPAASSAGERLSQPPTAVLGCDDIYWMHQLHSNLLGKGYHMDDEEVEEWTFGQSTQSAILTFQACEGLSETGFADNATWRKLLGDSYNQVVADAPTDPAGPAAGPAAAPPAANGAGPTFAAPAPAAAATASSNGAGRSPVAPVREAAAVGNRSSPAVPAEQEITTKWPILREGDGNRAVHAMQVALSRHGYSVGEDDARWWFFGDTTYSALLTFQACSHLSESGVCDEDTWKALLGSAAAPGHIDGLQAGDETDDDMHQAQTGGGVWLLGEQRWERRP